MVHQIQDAIGAVLAWVGNHEVVLIPMAIILVADLKTSLTNYPRVETTLGIIADLLSFHTNKDSPDTMKMIGTRSKPPAMIGSALPCVPPTVVPSRIQTPRPLGGFVSLWLLFVIALVSCLACACTQRPGASCDASVTSVAIGLLDHPWSEARGQMEALAASVGADKVRCSVGAIIGGMEGGRSMGVRPISQVQVLTSGRAYLSMLAKQ